MDTEVIRKRFKEMGASVEVHEGPDLTVDCQGDKYILTCTDDTRFEVSHSDPRDRHLLLMARAPDPANRFRPDLKLKWLCGHDERDWFVAAVPSMGVRDVRTAKESLKPDAVKDVEKGLTAKDKNKRKNEARTRQGEWFFVPASVSPPKAEILKNEPLRSRPGSEPHVCQQAWRTGGTAVWIVQLHGETRFTPVVRVVDYEEYVRLRTERPNDIARVRQEIRDPTIYVSGTVRHTDHKTVVLKGWHQVYINEEANREKVPHASTTVVFLD